MKHYQLYEKSKINSCNITIFKQYIKSDTKKKNFENGRSHVHLAPLWNRGH